MKIRKGIIGILLGLMLLGAARESRAGENADSDNDLDIGWFALAMECIEADAVAEAVNNLNADPLLMEQSNLLSMFNSFNVDLDDDMADPSCPPVPQQVPNAPPAMRRAGPATGSHAEPTVDKGKHAITTSPETYAPSAPAPAAWDGGTAGCSNWQPAAPVPPFAGSTKRRSADLEVVDSPTRNTRAAPPAPPPADSPPRPLQLRAPHPGNVCRLPRRQHRQGGHALLTLTDFRRCGFWFGHERLAIFEVLSGPADQPIVGWLFASMLNITMAQMAVWMSRILRAWEELPDDFVSLSGSLLGHPTPDQPLPQPPPGDDPPDWPPPGYHHPDNGL